MTESALSLKATAAGPRETENPVEGLKQAQVDYLAARIGFRKRQRQILQHVYRSVSDLIDDKEACRSFMKDKAFRKYDGDPSTDRDVGDVWFRALAYVYQATSRSMRQKASKHASALRFLHTQDVAADKIAAAIKKRGGIQKLADAAAKDQRKGSKQGEGEADDAEPEAGDSEVNAAESGDAGDQEVRFDISDKLAAKIRKWRGNRVKIIARISRKVDGVIKVFKVIKLDSED